VTPARWPTQPNCRCFFLSLPADDTSSVSSSVPSPFFFFGHDSLHSPHFLSLITQTELRNTSTQRWRSSRCHFLFAFSVTPVAIKTALLYNVSVHSAFVLATRFRGRARGYNDMVVMGSLQLPEMLDTTPGKQETEMKMLESSLIRQATIALEQRMRRADRTGRPNYRLENQTSLPSSRERTRKKSPSRTKGIKARAGTCPSGEAAKS
jgi:hypothetical protein